VSSYTLLFRVGPPGLFGLPDGSRVVVDAETGREGTGPAIDTRSGHVVSYGQLSRFRTPDEAVALQCSLGSGTLQVSDNLFQLSLEAASQREAVQEGTALLDQLVRILGVEYGVLFPYETLQVESDSGELEVAPGPRQIMLMEGTIYSLDSLRERILAAAALSVIEDDTLSRALVYHEHAHWLFSLRSGLPMLSPHFAYVMTSAYLHLWKTITTILGDPAKDRDHQRRFRKYGLPKGFWNDQVKPLQDVRNDNDVAHYSLDPEAIKTAELSFGRAHEVCKTVIRAYTGYLVNQAVAESASGMDATDGVQPA
jgi:hypothetical protein